MIAFIQNFDFNSYVTSLIFLVMATSSRVFAASELIFPQDFLWGTSLSAHQAEGNNVNSWTRWEQIPGKIKNNDQSGRASDHWNRFQEDFDNLQWLHTNTFRMSLEWSRLEPKKGEWDQKAANHYRKMIANLKKKQIRPIICLFHFTLPLWVEDSGGFENPENIGNFVNFVHRSQMEFGDLVNDWLTLNEPVVYAMAAYGAGLTPPGIRDLKRTFRVVANLMHAHGLAYRELKKLDPTSSVSFAHHLRVFTPKNWFNPMDHFAAYVADKFFNWSWYETEKTGKIRIHVPFLVKIKEDCKECVDSLDYLGFNYYGRDLVSFNPLSNQKFFVTTRESATKSDMGWEIFPDGLRIILKKIKQKKLDHFSLLITENGIADADDSRRSKFIYDHLRAFLEESQSLGLKPKGYLYWSVIDNFEWIDGFGPRFGLFSVDYKSQKRSPRESAYYFRKIGQMLKLVPPS